MSNDALMEMYAKLAVAHDEASKIEGLPDPIILRQMELRDHYLALTVETAKR